MYAEGTYYGAVAALMWYPGTAVQGSVHVHPRVFFSGRRVVPEDPTRTVKPNSACCLQALSRIDTSFVYPVYFIH